MEETKRSGMSKDQFWNLIEKAKEVCGTDLDASAVWIKQQLFYMTPEDVLQFHNLVYSYRDAAYKYGLWTAAGIMMERELSALHPGAFKTYEKGKQGRGRAACRADP